MKRRPRFLAIIASAVITFGILMTTVGHRNFKHGKEHFGDRQHNTCKIYAETPSQPNVTK